MGKKLELFLAGLILGGSIVLILADNGKKPNYSPYIRQIEAKQELIDSLLANTDDSVIVRYKERVKIVYKYRDEKIDSIVSLEPDDKLEFFSEWVSEMDSLSE